MFASAFLLFGFVWSLATPAAAAQIHLYWEQAGTTEQEDSPCHGLPCETDSRACIDVRSYEVDLDFTGRGKHWLGAVTIEMSALHDTVDKIELDVGRHLVVRSCSIQPSEGSPVRIPFLRNSERLILPLQSELNKGQTVKVIAKYEGNMHSASGQGWAAMRSPSGTLRFDCSLQYAGAHHLFPCKAAFYHPSDTPEHSRLQLRIPGGLKAVGPGQVESKQRNRDGSSTIAFNLDHSVPTWGLGFAIGPFEVKPVEWQGSAESPLKVEIYCLPEHRSASERATKELPAILNHLESIFGPYPFPEEGLAIVETLSSSSANASWIGIGSQFFTMSERSPGEKGQDPHPFGGSSRILSHELGHAWWGCGLSVESWRDAWLHESFATYGELLYVGASQGEEKLQAAFDRLADRTSPKSRLLMCGRAERNAETASGTALWFKGPWVLRALQYELGDDALWFQTLAGFQEDHRFQTVSTPDLMDALETASGHSWDRFFKEWFEGRWHPRVRGVVQAHEREISININNHKDEERVFHVPIDVQWTEAGESFSKRILLHPGDNELSIACSKPDNVVVNGLDHVLGLHHIRVVPRAAIGLPGRK